MTTSGVLLVCRRVSTPRMPQPLLLGRHWSWGVWTPEGSVTGAASAIEMYLGVCPGVLQKALAKREPQGPERLSLFFRSEFAPRQQKIQGGPSVQCDVGLPMPRTGVLTSGLEETGSSLASPRAWPCSTHTQSPLRQLAFLGLESIRALLEDVPWFSQNVASSPGTMGRGPGKLMGAGPSVRSRDIGRKTESRKFEHHI